MHIHAFVCVLSDKVCVFEIGNFIN